MAFTRWLVLSGLAVVAILAVGPHGGGPVGDSDVPVPSWAHVAPEQIAEARKYGVPVAFENALRMRFVLVPVGAYQMGAGERAEERPAHTVILSCPFYIQVTETTNEAFREFRRDHVSPTWEGDRLDGPLHPVVGVSWEDAVEFAAWLSRGDGTRDYRLPTEAEWEYACRAQASERYFWGDSEAVAGKFANVGDRSVEALSLDALGVFPVEDGWFASAPCGSFLPNRWGLHDMLGNVWEWCADWEGPYAPGQAEDPKGPAKGVSRVWRGGSWAEGPYRVRSAQRGCGFPSSRVVNVGFRLVSPLPPPR